MKYFVALLFVCFFGYALADGVAQLDTNKTVAHIGMNDAEGNGYFTVNEPLSVNCKWGAIMFSGKYFASFIMAAKLSGKTLSIVNYKIDSTTQLCTLVSIDMV